MGGEREGRAVVHDNVRAARLPSRGGELRAAVAKRADRHDQRRRTPRVGEEEEEEEEEATATKEEEYEG